VRASEIGVVGGRRRALRWEYPVSFWMLRSGCLVPRKYPASFGGAVPPSNVDSGLTSFRSASLCGLGAYVIPFTDAHSVGPDNTLRERADRVGPGHRQNTPGSTNAAAQKANARRITIRRTERTFFVRPLQRSAKVTFRPRPGGAPSIESRTRRL
jgi:hypothetical protein